MKCVHVETVWGDEDVALSIDRTPECLEKAKELSEYIKALDLPKEQNDRLVALMVDQVALAEKGAFTQGFTMGTEFGRWDALNPEQEEGR